MRQPPQDLEAAGRRGLAACDAVIKGKHEVGNEHKYVVIDFDTLDFEIDADEGVASHRLHARNPNGLCFLTRVGSPFARRSVGAGPRGDPRPRR